MQKAPQINKSLRPLPNLIEQRLSFLWIIEKRPETLPFSAVGKWLKLIASRLLNCPFAQQISVSTLTEKPVGARCDAQHRIVAPLQRRINKST